MIGNLRLISGLVLFIFVLGHFFNHMLGIVSLRAMDEAWYYTIEPWRTLPGTILIVSALLVHASLAVWGLYVRRSLRMKSWEVAQLILGFLIPLLLAAHVTSTRGGYEAFGLETGYGFQFYSQWVAYPIYGAINFTALFVVWLHSCIGWHFWLRLKPWYAKYQNIAFALAVAVPVLAVAGIISGGFRVLRLSRSEKWVEGLFKKLGDRADEYSSFVFGFEDLIQLNVIAVLCLLALIHVMRRYIVFSKDGQNLSYRNLGMSGRKKIKILPGASILDSVKSAGVQHASVCGGRGRCSTCRIRIDEGLEKLEPASESERKVLNRIGAPEDVRLACQLYPDTNLAVTALLATDARPEDGFGDQRTHHGDEQEVTVLFADIREFTKLSEDKLPFDTAFLLNRYFEAMGGAIEEQGGHIDKFIGDGVMALFGIDQPLETGARQALNAARKMSEKLEALNASLSNDLREPLRIGIGIHSGTAIVGELGYSRAVNLTAIGDVVNTASRLEALTKQFGVQLVVSESTLHASGIDTGNFLAKDVEVRGKTGLLPVKILASAREMTPV
ncbi:MAG: adenylate/guanylate cyclase domain-containing protein [Pseudomonadota bacterium]